MANERHSNDPLFNKLDNLMQSGHARKPRDPPPLLTDAVPDADESRIPTLTDAVEPPESPPAKHQESEQRGQEPDDPRTLIASRLVAAVDKEMEELSKELPVHGHKLAVLHRSLRFALPELVRLRWEDAAEQDTNARNGVDTDPDQ